MGHLVRLHNSGLRPAMLPSPPAAKSEGVCVLSAKPHPKAGLGTETPRLGKATRLLPAPGGACLIEFYHRPCLLATRQKRGYPEATRLRGGGAKATRLVPVAVSLGVSVLGLAYLEDAREGVLPFADANQTLT